MSIKSKILLNEKLNNKDKKFGAANEYYQAFIYDESDTETFALFTKHEISQAIKRGNKNPEDQGCSFKSQKRWWKIF